MKNTYWNNRGKYQSEFDSLYEKLVPEIGIAATENGELLRQASNLYYEYYNNGNMNVLDYKNDDDFEGAPYIRKSYLNSLDFIVKHIPNLSKTIYIISSKMTDEEVSEEMEYLYEDMIDNVVKYIMDQRPLHIRDGFKVSFEEIPDLVRDKSYQYKLQVSTQKNIMTGLDAMSLDELEFLAKSINKYVKRMRKS